MTHIQKTTILLLTILVVSGTAFAQRKINCHFKILNKNTQQTISNADIEIDKFSYTTNESGEVQIELLEGKYDVIVSKGKDFKKTNVPIDVNAKDLPSYKLFIAPMVETISIASTDYAQSAYNIFVADIHNNRIDSSYRINGVPNISGGSVKNLNLLTKGKVDFALMQSDVYLQIADTSKIKIAIPLYPSELHLIARKNSNIKTLKDLNNQTVIVSRVGSGSKFTADHIKKALNINWNDREYNFHKGFKTAFYLLNRQSVGAIFFVEGHPFDVLAALPENKNFNLIDIDSDILESMGYKKTTIETPNNYYYHFQNKSVKTHSVRSLLVCRKDTDTKKIKFVLNSILENLENLKSNGHPKWKDINPRDETYKINLHSDVKDLIYDN